MSGTTRSWKCFGSFGALVFGGGGTLLEEINDLQHLLKPRMHVRNRLNWNLHAFGYEHSALLSSMLLMEEHCVNENACSTLKNSCQEVHALASYSNRSNLIICPFQKLLT